MPHSIAFTFHQKYWLKFCVIKKYNWGKKKTQVQIIARQVFTTKYTKWPPKKIKKNYSDLVSNKLSKLPKIFDYFIISHRKQTIECKTAEHKCVGIQIKQ